MSQVIEQDKAPLKTVVSYDSWGEIKQGLKRGKPSNKLKRMIVQTRKARQRFYG